MRPVGLCAFVVLAASSAVVTGLSVPAAAVPASTSGAGLRRADDTAQRKDVLDRQVDEIRESLEGTSADLVEAAVRLRRAQAGLVTVRARLAKAEAALAAAERRDAQVAADLAYARAEEEKAVRSLAAQTAAEAASRVSLGRIAREAYTGGSSMTGLSIALQAQSPDEFAARMAVAGSALRSENSEVGRLVVVRAELRARAAKVGALRERTAQLKQLSADVVEQRQAAKADAASAADEQSRLVKDQRAALTVVTARRDEEKARLDRVQAEADALAKVLRARAEAARRERERARKQRASRGSGSAAGGGSGSGSGSDSGAGSGSRRDAGAALSYPVSAPVTSGFGMRFHPVLHYWRLHAGTDFGAACGTPVRAAADGTVVRAGWAGGFGNQVVVDHGYVRGVDLASSYNHLSRISASGRVRRGEVIGLSGTTGLSTGCHLHFEVYENGSPVNPMRWL